MSEDQKDVKVDPSSEDTTNGPQLKPEEANMLAQQQLFAQQQLLAAQQMMAQQNYDPQAFLGVDAQAYEQQMQMDPALRQQMIQQYQQLAMIQQHAAAQQAGGDAAAMAAAVAANSNTAMQAAYSQFQSLTPAQQQAAYLQNQQLYQQLIQQIYAHPQAQQQVIALQRQHQIQQQQLVQQTQGKPNPAQQQQLLQQQQGQQIQLLQQLAAQLQHSTNTSNGVQPVVALVCDNESLSSGSSCHQCKTRRVVNELYFCGSTHMKKGKAAKRKRKRQICRKKYCCRCLIKFYSELPPQKPPNGMPFEWACPGCRGICSCAACKRGKGKGDDIMPMSFPGITTVTPEQQQAMLAQYQLSDQQQQLLQQQQQLLQVAAAQHMAIQAM